MKAKRTRPEAVRQIVAKQRAAEEPAVTVTGSASDSDTAMDALERLIQIGREVDERLKRERGSKP